MNSAVAPSIQMQPAGDFRNPSDRMRFFAQHLYDLQSLRWMPAQVALITSPLWFGARAPLTGSRQLGLLFLASGCTWMWFQWFTEHVRNRYGETEVSEAVKTRHRYPASAKALMIGIGLLLFVWVFIIDPTANMGRMALGVQLCIFYLGRVFDPTNFLCRRIWTGVAIFTTMIVCMLGDAGKVHIAANTTIGSALLFIALADYLLLMCCAKKPAYER